MNEADCSDSKPRTQYLNTDLDLISEHDLTSLVAALEQRGVFALHCTQVDDGKWYSVLEVETNADAPGLENPQATISLFLEAIESLDAAQRAQWDDCSKREFNIGYYCGDERLIHELRPETIVRMAQAGLALGISLYSQPKEPAPQL